MQSCRFGHQMNKNADLVIQNVQRCRFGIPNVQSCRFGILSVQSCRFGNQMRKNADLVTDTGFHTLRHCHKTLLSIIYFL